MLEQDLSTKDSRVGEAQAIFKDKLQAADGTRTASKDLIAKYSAVIHLDEGNRQKKIAELYRWVVMSHYLLNH